MEQQPDTTTTATTATTTTATTSPTNPTSPTKSDLLQGQVFVFSGFRNKGLEQSIIEAGGQVDGFVSNRTTLLLYQDGAEHAAKHQQAMKLGVKCAILSAFPNYLEELQNAKWAASETSAAPLEAHLRIVSNALNVRLGSAKKSHFRHDVQNIMGYQLCLNGRMFDDENTDWCNHKDKRIGKHFLEYFPVALFMGKRGGDVVEMTILGKKINVTLVEGFEHMLYDLTQSFGGITAVGYNDSEFTIKRYEEMQMIIDTHKAYAKSLGFEIKDPMTFRYVECNKNYHGFIADYNSKN